MPCRARCQLPAFHEYAIAPALFRQVIEGRDADHAASDDDRARVAFHGYQTLIASMVGRSQSYQWMSSEEATRATASATKRSRSNEIHAALRI